MTASFRPATLGDAPAILGLFAEAGLHPDVEPRHLHWKYWQLRADWPDSRSFVMADGSELIAHVAIVPGRCAWRTQRIKLGQLIDWAASPRAPFAGIALLNLIGQQQAILAVGGSDDALQILPRIGFQALGVVTSYVRPLHPQRLRPPEGSPPSWRLAARVARSIAWRVTAPPARRTDWHALSVVAEDLGRLSSVFPDPEQGMAVFERSLDLFHYMLSCPIVPMTVFAVEKADRLRGYYVLACTPGQVRIADCWMDSEDPADWRALILCAVEQANHDPQAAEVVIWGSDPGLAQALEACGFHARFETPILLRPGGDGLVPEGPLHVQMLDTDLAYLHGGRKEFWS